MKEKILKQYKEKIRDLVKHNELYFNDDNPKISDSEYDKLKTEILILEKKYSFISKLALSKKIVGSKPSSKFKKINHLQPMLSLSNAFKKKDMEDFLKKVKNFLNLKNDKIELFSEPKIDGISATLIYKNGQLKNGLSRGDGITGEDILDNLKTISNQPESGGF